MRYWNSRHKLLFSVLMVFIIHLYGGSAIVNSASYQLSNQSATLKALHERKWLFDQVSLLTQVPWYFFAAIDQYERTLHHIQQKVDPAPENRLLAIHISANRWAGMLNPNVQDTNPETISFFGGIGVDGSGDHLANRWDDLDVLATIARFIQKKGSLEEDLWIGIWDYYQNSRAVERITQFTKIYKSYLTLELQHYKFPLPLTADYAYQSTWGAKRGWGGRRLHEGIDLFASSGVPVNSSSYGVIEELGWNKFGGWRVGIRDLQNIYHYYAHLSGFSKKMKVGDIVKPGQTIGWIGSSGYGKPGTSGKFPPHLHYGLYRDYGEHDWPFDPYPLLRKWEREQKASR